MTDMRKRLDTPEAELLREVEQTSDRHPASSVRPRVEAYRGRVLVVDDSDDVRNLLATVLEAHGFDVLVAQNGEEGVAFYRALHRAIDAVVLDMEMPGMDGAATLVQLQRVNPLVRAIVCSGGVVGSRIEQALRDGARAFLPKPFLPNELVDLVERVVNADRDDAHPTNGPAGPVRK